MITRTIPLKDGKTVEAIEIPLPNASLIMVKGSKGYIMCGYLNLLNAEKMGDNASVVKGVRTIDDLLSAPIVEATSSAINSGIVIGMKGYKALELIA